MSAFLYFLPDVSARPTSDDISRYGLEHLLNTGFINAEVFSGPDGRKGCVVVPKVNGVPLIAVNRVGYFPDLQNWVGKRDCRLGYFKDSIPTPSELKRESIIRGHDCVDAQGKKWTVPAARRMSDTDGDLRWQIALPQRSVLVDGEWLPGPVVDQYRALWETSETIWNEFTGADVDAENGSLKLSFDGAHCAAVLALSTNYHVEAEELNEMGSFETEFVREVLEAVVDFPAFREFAEKKTANVSSSSDVGTTA